MRAPRAALVAVLVLLALLPAGAVAAGPATHFVVSAPASATAGSAFAFAVTAQDASNATATGYTGIVHFTSIDGQAVLPANSTLTNGVGIFSATLKTAGNQTIAATDTVASSIAGTSNAIAVSAAAATHFTLAAPAAVTTGVSLGFAITARDQFGNTATGYAGTVHFASSDGAATLPANVTLTNGTRSLSATLRTLDTQTITANDTGAPGINGTASILVALPATHLGVVGPASTVAGFPALVTVTALDAGGGLAAGYTGTVHFTSSDAHATLPADMTLTNGVGTAIATFTTLGSQTITATDTLLATIAGTSAPIVVGSPPPAPGGPPPGKQAAPTIHGLAVRPLCVSTARLLSAPKRGHGALAISFTLSAGARVSVEIDRLVHAPALTRCPHRAGSTKGKLKLVKTLSGSAGAGHDTLALAASAGRRTLSLARATKRTKPLAPGAYLVRVRATDTAGHRSTLATAKFFVLRPR